MTEADAVPDVARGVDAEYREQTPPCPKASCHKPAASACSLCSCQSVWPAFQSLPALTQTAVCFHANRYPPTATRTHVSSALQTAQGVEPQQQLEVMAPPWGSEGGLPTPGMNPNLAAMLNGYNSYMDSSPSGLTPYLAQYGDHGLGGNAALNELLSATGITPRGGITMSPWGALSPTVPHDLRGKSSTGGEVSQVRAPSPQLY